MPAFIKGGAPLTPFGVNEFLRSTVGVKRESYTVYAGAVATETIDTFVNKILQRGEVMAKITSGPGAGMIGPFDDNVSVTDGRQLVANIVGINDTFLPWQLKERDVEVAVVYEATVVQAWCFERENGARIPLATAGVLTALMTNTTNKRMNIHFV